MSTNPDENRTQRGNTNSATPTEKASTQGDNERVGGSKPESDAKVASFDSKEEGQTDFSDENRTVPLSELENARKDLLYLRAEFENYRKQALKERSELIRYGGERLILQLLDVFDNFDRALVASNKNQEYEVLRQGIEMTNKEIRRVFEQFGIVEIAALGKPFDPTKHEALSSTPSAEYAPGTVVQVFRSGFTFHEKLIRPALVVVAAENASST